MTYVRDTSLRVPPGFSGTVREIRVSSSPRTGGNPEINRAELERQLQAIQAEHLQRTNQLIEELTEKLSGFMLGETLPSDVINARTGEIIVPANCHITRALLRKLASTHDLIEIKSLSIRTKLLGIIHPFEEDFQKIDTERERKLDQLDFDGGTVPRVIKRLKITAVAKKVLSVGDRLSDPNGHKGVVTAVLPEEDMPHLADGTPVDLILHPLKFPSLTATQLFAQYRTQTADSEIESGILSVKNANRLRLFDGRSHGTLESATVGIIHMLRTRPGSESSAVTTDLPKPTAPLASTRKLRTPQKYKTPSPLRKEAILEADLTDSWDVNVISALIRSKSAIGETPTFLFVGRKEAELLREHLVEVFGADALENLQGAYFMGLEVVELEHERCLYVGACQTRDIQPDSATTKLKEADRRRIYEAIVKGDEFAEGVTPESFNTFLEEMHSLDLDVRPGKRDSRQNAPGRFGGAAE